MAPLPAGGPFDLDITAASHVIIHDVLVGDVWLCSGQSNMQMSVSGVVNADAELASSTIPELRLFQTPQVFSKTPLLLTPALATWQLSAPASAGPFSAACFFFGRQLQARLGVPIGLIHSSWGGTPAEAWTSPEALSTIEDFTPALSGLPEASVDQNAVTVLYNAMIAPLIPYAIRGVTWYQGESNAWHPTQYKRLLQTMIHDWRQRFGCGDFPFLIVQLANYSTPQTTPVEDNGWATLREAQLLTALAGPATGMASAIDIGETWQIHPRDKQDVGYRLELAALQVAYGQNVQASGPVYQSFTRERGALRLHFSEVGSGLMVAHKDGIAPVQELLGAKLQNFAIAGADKIFVAADAVIDGQDIVVTSSLVPQPEAVRYAWATNPVVTLYNRDGLPASPFRTDRDTGVNVLNGSGSGSYSAGSVVALTANPPAPGMSFNRWVGDTAQVADVHAAVTTVTVRDAYISLRATYR